MRQQPNQSNSVIGQWEEETGNCRLGIAQNPLGGRLRQITATAVVAVACLLGAGHQPSNSAANDGLNVRATHSAVQRADIIDDIIDIIDDIINPPSDPEP